MKTQQTYCKKHAALRTAAQVVVATVLGSLARGWVFLSGKADPLTANWVGNVVIVGPLAGEMVEMAALLAWPLEAYADSTPDEYFDLLEHSQFFATDGDEDEMSLNDMWQRLQSIQQALNILLQNGPFLELASEHLLTHGELTESDARSFMQQCDRPDLVMHGSNSPSPTITAP